MTIVTTHYRYKRPPRKRKAVALDVPAVVKKEPGKTRQSLVGLETAQPIRSAKRPSAVGSWRSGGGPAPPILGSSPVSRPLCYGPQRLCNGRPLLPVRSVAEQLRLLGMA
jgi:hypothetical protein